MTKKPSKKAKQSQTKSYTEKKFNPQYENSSKDQLQINGNTATNFNAKNREFKENIR